MTMRDNERAVSIAVSHTLTLAVTGILVTTLLIAAGGYLQSQQETAAREQLRDISADLGSLVDRLDSLSVTGEKVNASLTANYPPRVTGEPYDIALITEGAGRSTNATLYMNSSAVPDSVGVKMRTDTPMEQSFTRSENPDVSLCWDGTDQYITLGSCS